MGQATVDLPDPLQQTPAGGAKNADDLLAQLAGDEIDRLLAEGEAPAGAPPVAPESTTLDEVAANGPVKVAETTEAPENPSAVDLDAVLATAAATPIPTPAEQAALAAPIPETEQPADHSPPIELGDTRLPLILRPLEWLSAPLDPWPDQMRDALGKIGLLTLVNALAVLAYVFLFRKHH
jgi:hypothetical protein